MREILVVFFVAVFAAVGVAAAQEKPAGETQEKKVEAAQEVRWDGNIVRINEDQSTVIIRRGNFERTAFYDSSTKWTRMNKPAELREFEAGSRVLCVGRFDEKGQFIATRIDLRSPSAAKP